MPKNPSLSPAEQVQVLAQHSVDFINEADLLERLKGDRPLRIKLGADPSAPDIHLGHVVVLDKLRAFQDLGHQVVFIVGDFTARIGDPSGKSVTRPMLSEEDVRTNAQTYVEQVSKVLDPERTEMQWQSSWFDDFKLLEVIQLASRYTVARMLERDDFKKRFKSEQPIAVHEFMYPLMQAYDSVAIEADVELGGTDQLFNLLVGRHIQQAYGQTPQVVMTMPLLEGLDGVNKMSKSLNNYIGVLDSPDEMFGKTMSVSDEHMWRYFDLLNIWDDAQMDAAKQAIADGKNPRDVKFELGQAMVTRFHSAKAAQAAQDEFLARFQQGALPSDIQEVTLQAEGGQKGIAHVLKEAGLVPSTSEAFRMIKQGAVKIDSEPVTDRDTQIQAGDAHIVQVGKRRFAKVTLTS